MPTVCCIFLLSVDQRQIKGVDLSLLFNTLKTEPNRCRLGVSPYMLVVSVMLWLSSAPAGVVLVKFIMC